MSNILDEIKPQEYLTTLKIHAEIIWKSNYICLGQYLNIINNKLLHSCIPETMRGFQFPIKYINSLEIITPILTSKNAEQIENQQLFLTQTILEWANWKLEKQTNGDRLSVFTNSTSPGAEAHTRGQCLLEDF